MMDTEVRQPRVLVIASTPFSKTKNNGKTLSSFFEGYDRECVAQFSYSGGDCNKAVCDSYFILTKDDVLSGKQGAAYRADEIANSEKADEAPRKASFLKRVFHVFSQARNPVAVWLKDCTWKKADYRRAKEWIDRFNPDIVFFQGFSMAYGYDFALNVCEERKIPLILELTDDYTHRLYPLSLVEKRNLKRYMSVFTKAVQMAYKTIVISDLMKEEYESRFGGSMDVMMNAVNTDTVEPVAGERVHNDYVYAGNLLLNRWKVLRNLGKALEKVDPTAVLHIYTPDVPPKHILRALSKVPSIQYGGSLTKEELGRRLQLCGYVVHVEAFDRKNRKITRLSMSTKISEYVVSGARVLAIGPSDVASMRCLADNHLGTCINEASVAGILRALKGDTGLADYDGNAAAFIRRCASGSNGERIQHYIKEATKGSL